MNFVSFIVPTIGRTTLERTLNSLVAQTDPSWNAIVIGDAIENFSVPVRHDRILSVNLANKLGAPRNAGFVRDHGMSFEAGVWIAFVDDDDRVDENYVKWLKEESPDRDLVIFRMKYDPAREEDGATTLPPPDGSLGPGLVGISFAIRSQFQVERNLWFPSGEFEDWILIQTSMMAGARVKISEHTAYYIRH